MTDPQIKIPPGFDLAKEMEKLHPIVLDVCLHLTEDGDVEPEGIEGLKKGLLELKDSEGFIVAVEELLRTCYQWDTFPIGVDGECTYQPAAKAVLAVLNSAEIQRVYHEAGTEMAHEHGEERAKLGNKFAEFKDQDAPKAPKVGEEKPEGAVDLNALKFPKRL